MKRALSSMLSAFHLPPKESADADAQAEACASEESAQSSIGRWEGREEMQAPAFSFPPFASCLSRHPGLRSGVHGFGHRIGQFGPWISEKKLSALSSPHSAFRFMLFAFCFQLHAFHLPLRKKFSTLTGTLPVHRAADKDNTGMPRAPKSSLL